MPHLYLIRHGQDEDNAEGLLNGRRDRPLTELGREQARLVAGRLAGSGVEVILASPLRRALETASIIGGALGLAPRVVPGLIERDFGVLTGKPIADIPRYATRVLQTDRVLYFLEVEGAEGFPALRARARRVLDQVTGDCGDQRVLLVTHGDIGKMLRAAHHGWTWEEGLQTLYFDNTGVLELGPEGHPSPHRSVL